MTRPRTQLKKHELRIWARNPKFSTNGCLSSLGLPKIGGDAILTQDKFRKGGLGFDDKFRKPAICIFFEEGLYPEAAFRYAANNNLDNVDLGSGDKKRATILRALMMHNAAYAISDPNAKRAIDYCTFGPYGRRRLHSLGIHTQHLKSVFRAFLHSVYTNYLDISKCYISILLCFISNPPPVLLLLRDDHPQLVRRLAAMCGVTADKAKAALRAFLGASISGIRAILGGQLVNRDFPDVVLGGPGRGGLPTALVDAYDCIEAQAGSVIAALHAIGARPDNSYEPNQLRKCLVNYLEDVESIIIWQLSLKLTEDHGQVVQGLVHDGILVDNSIPQSIIKEAAALVSCNILGVAIQFHFEDWHSILQQKAPIQACLQRDLSLNIQTPNRKRKNDDPHQSAQVVRAKRRNKAY